MIVLSLGVFAVVGGVACALAASRLDRPGWYAVSKGVASGGLIAIALSSGMPQGWAAVVLGGLGMSAAGDLALAARDRRGIIAGLACFLVAYLLYATGSLVHGVDGRAAAVVAVFATAAAWLVWRRISGVVPSRLRRPLAAYIPIAALTVAMAAGASVRSGGWALALGTAAVAGSDIAVVRERFLGGGWADKVWGLPLYYAGQTLIALAVCGAIAA